jgi:uncharacterized protein (TIGR03083 family)
MSQGAIIAKDPVIAVLTEEWTIIDRLLTGVTAGEWTRPTCLPGWRITDVVAHLIGTEAGLAGDRTPECGVDVAALPHVRNDIAAWNEHWVQSLRDERPEAMLERFREVTARRGAQLRRMSQEEFDAPSWTPVGDGTYGRFMQIRTYDCWMHEQDIRDALGIPGGEDGPVAESVLDEPVRALGYIVGKRAGAPDGSVVRFDLTGPLRRELTVVVDGRAKLVDEAPGAPTATLRMGSGTFTRLTGGRTTDPAGVELAGDAVLAQRVLDSLAVTF